jgi:hypothetical protein
MPINQYFKKTVGTQKVGLLTIQPSDMATNLRSFIEVLHGFWHHTFNV